MDQAAPSEGPIGRHPWTPEPAGRLVQSDGQPDGLLVVAGVDRDELADLAEAPAGPVVEAGKDRWTRGDLQAHLLGEQDGEGMLQHRVGRPQARRDVQFPSLLWDAGISVSEPDPGRGGVGIRVEMPSFWLARVARAYLLNDRQIGPDDRGVRWARYAAILVEYAH